MILVTHRQRITFTTCSQATDFATHLLLFDTCPGLATDPAVATEDPDFVCSTLSYDVKEPGTYWLAVEGVGDEHGERPAPLVCAATSPRICSDLGFL